MDHVEVTLVIDFANGSIIKLSPVDPVEVEGMVTPLLLEGEQVYLAFKGMRRCSRVYQ